ncbi:hypothetical protein BRADI_3g02497v3 [Brachypodium distachyon]|uniref:RING-type domain-containing protein n=1 Tax=Brachypodium distachyon TaxID=15368 RepID=A0A2K2CUT0_BRADI|nr:hypothetical protein BRADI_3g02497v3 [Brachypodium distachyon]
MASQPPTQLQQQEIDVDNLLPSSPASSAASDADADHRRAVDDLLLLLSSSDSDSDEPSRSSSSPSTSLKPLPRIQAPPPRQLPKPSPPPSPSPSASDSPRRSTSASPPSATLSSLVTRTFSNSAASSSRPLPSLFRGVRPSPKPGAALAAAAAASRAVLTPHAAAIKSRRTASAPVDKSLDEGTGSEASEGLPSTGNLEAEVAAEKVSAEVVAGVTEETVGGSKVEELEDGKHGDVGIEVNSEPAESVRAGDVDSVAAGIVDEHEQIGGENLAETVQVGSQVGFVDEGSGDEQIRDENSMESDEIVDEVGSVSEENSDDEQEVQVSDNAVEEEVESVDIIDKVIEERLEISRKAEKITEKKLKVSMKPLEWAEELEKRQASFGQHWEEGAAAQPMRLEGIGKGQPAIGYMQIEVDNPITRAMASPSFRQDHGSPQVLAVHRSYIAMGMSSGAVIIVPSKYSSHQADDTDAKMLFFWNQGEKTQSPVTAMCFNPQGAVVHVCFIRQSKAITGDSKGLVLLHTFSIIPVINRLTVKGTQRLFDGNTGIVLSACPLLVDESLYSSNSSTQGNITSSSSGGLGSMMGGVVGVDSGWKFFNEGSSPVEDGVTVMFIMHQHALVVRLRTNIDHVDHIETFSRPEGAREGSIAYAAWKYTASSSDSPSVDEDRVSWLALAWDRQVQVAKFVKSKMIRHKEWKLDSSAVGVAWLNDQMLAVLNLRGQLCLFSKDGSELRRTIFILDGFVFDDSILYHTHFLNRFGNPERHFKNSVAVRGATVYILGPNFLTVSRLLPWKERIEALKRAGDWMGALDMAMKLYDGHTQGVVDLPRTVDSIREAIMPYLVELLLSYIGYVFEYISIALSNHTGKGGGADDLVDTDRSLLTQREEQYARVGGVAVEYCVHIGRNDILFDTVFSKFAAAQSGGMFLEVLEPYILKDMLGSLPPEIMQALVEHYSGKGWLQRVEQCILHMDISSLDFNQVVRLCREHGLYGALIYLFNQGLNDFRTPLEELLSVIQSATRKDATSTCYRMLVYLKYCFQGLAFPPGHGIIPRAHLHSVRKELLQFMLEESKMLTSEVFKGFNSSCGKCPNICYLLWMDTEATLEVVKCAFAQESFEPTSGILDASVPTDEGDTNTGSPESQNILLQSVVDTIIDIVGLENEATHSIFAGTAESENSEFWPSVNDLGYIIEFVSFFVCHKRANTSQRVLRHIVKYLTLSNTQSYDDKKLPTQKEEEVLQLFNVVPQTDWNSDYVLHLCLDAHFHQACGLIYAARDQNLAALDSYMKDIVEPFHAFIFINKKLLQLAGDEVLSFRSTVISRFPELVNLSRECAFVLVIDHFHNEIQQMLAELHSDHCSLFLFLKTAIEVHLSGKLDFSKLTARNDKIVERQYFSGELEDYLQRLSNLPKLFDRNPVSLTDELVELYLELLCQYEPRSALRFLETYDSYRLERCLHLCLDYGVTDAAAFLQERVGDVGSALALVLAGLDEKISQFISSVENTFSRISPKSISEIEQPDVVLKMSEAHPVLDTLRASIGLCQRNSQRLDPEESQLLWFQLLDSFSEPLKKLYGGKVVNGKGGRSEGGETTNGYPKGNGQMRISTYEKCLNALRRVFSQFVGEIIEAMAGYIPLPAIMAKLLSDNGSQEFGDFKLVIHRMLSMYLYEKRILETAKSVIEDDSFYTLSLLKRGVCHGFAPQTFVCCVCNCSLSKEGAISAVRVFSCGHATHLHCESEQSKSSNRDSKDGCPVCLSTSNTQARNKSSIISENGLTRYSVVENEVSHGIHHVHETDHAERSRGLQHMSRFEILNNLQKAHKTFHIETVPPLRLSPPAIYHEKIQKRVTFVGESSRHSVRTEKPQKIWQMKEPKLKKSGNWLPAKTSIFSSDKNQVR